jgi:hypothetical protein
MKDLKEKSTAPSFVDRDQEKKREKAMAARELRDEEETFLKTLGKDRKIGCICFYETYQKYLLTFNLSRS